MLYIVCIVIWPKEIGVILRSYRLALPTFKYARIVPVVAKKVQRMLLARGRGLWENPSLRVGDRIFLPVVVLN